MIASVVLCKSTIKQKQVSAKTPDWFWHKKVQREQAFSAGKWIQVDQWCHLLGQKCIAHKSKIYTQDAWDFDLSVQQKQRLYTSVAVNVEI